MSGRNDENGCNRYLYWELVMEWVLVEGEENGWSKGRSGGRRSSYEYF